MNVLLLGLLVQMSIKCKYTTLINQIISYCLDKWIQRDVRELQKLLTPLELHYSFHRLQTAHWQFHTERFASGARSHMSQKRKNEKDTHCWELYSVVNTHTCKNEQALQRVYKSPETVMSVA